MTTIDFYKAFGYLVLALLFYVELVGWTWADMDEVHKVPRTVRDNPGAYRSHYHTHVHYSGGK
jgi:hypothetical protein